MCNKRSEFKNLSRRLLGGEKYLLIKTHAMLDSETGDREATLNPNKPYFSPDVNDCTLSVVYFYHCS